MNISRLFYGFIIFPSEEKEWRGRFAGQSRSPVLLGWLVFCSNSHAARFGNRKEPSQRHGPHGLMAAQGGEVQGVPGGCNPRSLARPHRPSADQAVPTFCEVLLQGRSTGRIAVLKQLTASSLGAFGEHRTRNPAGQGLAVCGTGNLWPDDRHLVLRACAFCAPG